MSTRTTYMTHYNSAVTGFVSAQVEYLKKTAGLADTLFIGLCEQWKEMGDDFTIAAFDSALKEAEDSIKDTLPDGVTLSAYCPAFRVRKSEIKRCLKAKLDPTNFNSFKAMLKAVKKDDPPKGGDGKTVTGGSNNSTPPTADGGNVANLVTSNMPDAVRKYINEALKTLASLPEDQAIAAAKGFANNAAARLRKAGGRYSNVSKKTA